MAKNKGSGLSTALNTFNLIGSLLLIFLIIILISLVYGVYSGKITIPGLNPQQTLIPSDLDKTDYTPDDADSCADYDISQEHREAFGDDSINTVRTSCQAVGGKWIETSKQMGCLWNPEIFTMDCSSATIAILTNFCEGDLLADYRCDNTYAWTGCSCNRNPPGQSSLYDDCTDLCNNFEWSYGYSSDNCDQGEEYHEYDGLECCCSDYVSDDAPPNQEDNEPGQSFTGTIFVSKTQWNGAMGGLSGADNKCSFAATTAGLSGSWIALLSDSTTDARDRVSHISSFYNMGGQLVASNTAELFSGKIKVPIKYDEYGSAINSGINDGAWTGSKADGTYYDNMACNDWKWVSNDGIHGNPYATDMAWLNNYGGTCVTADHIYCVRIN